jgi:hypothetical protein
MSSLDQIQTQLDLMYFGMTATMKLSNGREIRIDPSTIKITTMKKEFQYPEEFKQRVLKVFPGNSDIKHKLETGNQWLGGVICDSQRNIEPETILNMLKTPDGIQSLVLRAEREIELKALHNEYWRLINNFKSGI